MLAVLGLIFIGFFVGIGIAMAFGLVSAVGRLFRKG